MSTIILYGIWTVGVLVSPARYFIGLGILILLFIILPILTNTIYRFTIPEIRYLVPLLRLHEIKWSYRVSPNKEIAFCVVLAQLANPNR
jgi:hypothetical protein